MNSALAEPCVSGATFDLALLGMLLGIAGFCALVGAAQWFRRIAKAWRLQRLGADLLDVSGGDWPTAQRFITEFRASNAELDAAVRAEFAPMRLAPEFAERRAAFNAACRDDNDGGPRWTDVQ